MFKTNPGLVPIPGIIGIDLFWLDAPLVYVGSCGKVTIPRGFITDDASIPKFLDWVPFLDRQGLSRRPGLLHDGLYSLGRAKGKDYCDAVLREACLSEGMSSWGAGCIYQGVHMFGGSSWDGDAHNGTFGKVGAGEFITDEDYHVWLAAGATVFQP